MSFHEGSWSSRVGALGDEAEAVFAQLFPNHIVSGLRRPPVAVSKLSMMERNRPDFLLAEGFCEVMGCGGRQASLKLKAEKLIALCMWSSDSPVDLFVWNSTKRCWWRAPVWKWLNACLLHGVVRQFADNLDRPYFDLKPEFFPVAPTTLAESA